MFRVKKNDTVVVLSGKDKGKRGVVLQLDMPRGKVLVQGVAFATHHVKAKRPGETGGIKKEESFIDESKVMPVCSPCNRGVRVNFMVEGDEKSRVCNRCKSGL